MPDTQKLFENKEKIIATIKIKCPSLPIHLARIINQPPLFTSAFLAELLADKRLKISNMKVGSSPLYYIQGQELMLENFVEYLSPIEKEAFSILKQEKVLRDSDLQPVTRVAIRSIPDFAIPVQIRIGEDIILFWRYFQISDNEMHNLINSISTSPRQSHLILPSQTSHPQIEQTPSKPQQEQALSTILKDMKPIPRQKQISLQKQKKSSIESVFVSKLKEYLTAKDIEIIEILSEKKKEFMAKVRIDTLFGKQTYYLTAKDKKKITENDLTLALHKSQAEKMPCVVLSPGDLDKKAQEYRKEWHNTIKFEKLKI